MFCGTLGFRGTPVEEHCVHSSRYSHETVAVFQNVFAVRGPYFVSVGSVANVCQKLHHQIYTAETRVMASISQIGVVISEI